MAALILGLLALTLAGPVPAVLSRARWPRRAPRAALALWQAVALAALLSTFGTGLAIAARLLIPVIPVIPVIPGSNGHATTAPTAETEALGWPLWTGYVSVFAVTLLVGARLAVSVIRTGTDVRRRRARHRVLVDLLDRPPPNGARSSSSSLRVVAARQPLAYCLPGLQHRIVISDGAFAALRPEEIDAILTHERSHLKARHDLVLEAFTAVYVAFPRFVRSRSALGSVSLLVEMLADDSARRAAGAVHLARALVACADGVAPRGALAIGGAGTLARVERLRHDNSPAVAACAYSGAGAVLSVPTIAVALPWLVEVATLAAL